VPARSIINFKIKGKSIYHRKHPLKPNTLARIEAGLRKFGLNPFLIQPGHANHQGEDDSYRSTTLEQPLGTLPCSNRFALIQPFLIELHGTSAQHLNNSARNLNQPLGCVTAGGGHFGLVQPVVTCPENGTNPEDPFNEGQADPEIPSLNPYLIHCNHEGSERIRSIDTPLPTVCGTRGEMALLEPYLIKYFGTGTAASITTHWTR
jgi:DNA (cytosine-5)-methyltransferase 1